MLQCLCLEHAWSGSKHCWNATLHALGRERRWPACKGEVQVLSLWGQCQCHKTEEALHRTQRRWQPVSLVSTTSRTSLRMDLPPPKQAPTCPSGGSKPPSYGLFTRPSPAAAEDLLWAIINVWLPMGHNFFLWARINVWRQINYFSLINFKLPMGSDFFF